MLASIVIATKFHEARYMDASYLAHKYKNDEFGVSISAKRLGEKEKEISVALDYKFIRNGVFEYVALLNHYVLYLL